MTWLYRHDIENFRPFKKLLKLISEYQSWRIQCQYKNLIIFLYTVVNNQKFEFFEVPFSIGPENEIYVYKYYKVSVRSVC